MILLMYVNDLISLMTISDSIDANRSKIFSCIGNRDLNTKNIGMRSKTMRIFMHIARIRHVLSEESIDASMI